MSVLLIDDSPFDLFISQKLMDRHYPEVEIKSFTAGRDALEFLKTSAPDRLPSFIFLDILMPVMNGFEFLHEYGKLPASITGHCKLYMLTSSENTSDKERARKNPFVKGYIVKPVHEHVFKDIFDKE